MHPQPWAASHGGHQAAVSARSGLRSLERFGGAGGLGAQAQLRGLSLPAPGLPALPALFCASPGGPLLDPLPALQGIFRGAQASIPVPPARPRPGPGDSPRWTQLHHQAEQP